MPRPAKTRVPFAERLVRVRTAKGLTQTELARLTGVSQRVIARYETIVKNPTSDVVVALANALKITVDELMGRKPVKIKEEVSRKTIKKAKMLEELPPEDQKTITRMIDRLHADATRKT